MGGVRSAVHMGLALRMQSENFMCESSQWVEEIQIQEFSGHRGHSESGEQGTKVKGTFREEPACIWRDHVDHSLKDSGDPATSGWERVV